ncbi:MAG: DPP IV N-terminal domain-containing protein [Syntrophales bacterium]
MNIHLNRLIFTFTIVIILLINGCNSDSKVGSQSDKESTPKYDYICLQFLNGNDKLLFHRYRYDHNDIKENGLFIYEISSHNLYKPLSMNGENYPRIPIFSRDKKQVAFVSSKDGGRNIYVMNADGSNVRQLTYSQHNAQQAGAKLFEEESNDGPSFSPDGKRILFKRGRWMKGGTPLWSDVFEIEISTGRERRLTNIDSHLMSNPFYLSDGKRFVFQGSKKIKDEGIYIANNESHILNKISAGGWWIPGPRISWNDKIVFLKGNDLFIYENGNIKRLNWIQKRLSLRSLAISPDGSKVYFETEAPIDSSKLVRSQWIGKADGTELQEISIQWEHLKKSTLD